MVATRLGGTPQRALTRHRVKLLGSPKLRHNARDQAILQYRPDLPGACNCSVSQQRTRSVVLMSSITKDVQETLEGLRKQVLSSVDWGIKSVSTTVSTTAVSAQDEANKLIDKSKVCPKCSPTTHSITAVHRNCLPLSQTKPRHWNPLQSPTSEVRCIAVTHAPCNTQHVAAPPDGVRTVATYHPASTIALSGVALLAFGPTRRLIYRITLARFRSEEGAFRSAEVRLKALQDGATQSAMETRKLEERLSAAQQEYARGLAKLQGTGQQLLALSRGLRSVERNTDGVFWMRMVTQHSKVPPPA